MTHPLQHDWVLWEHRTGSDESSYSNNLQQLGEFNTVEGFFRYVKHMPWPSEFFYTKGEPRLRLADRDVVGFSMFKKGVKPCWEDPQNIDGGEWRIRKFSSIGCVDEAWKQCTFLLIGNQFDEEINITGCRVVDSSHPEKNRAMYNVEIWFSDTTQYQEVETLISKELHTDSSKMFFRTHSTDNGNKEKILVQKKKRHNDRPRKTTR